MGKVNSYPTATVADADLILGWDDSAARVIAPALTAWRAALISGAATSIATSDLTASRALASDGSGKVGVSAATATELGYLAGATSGLQTQLNAVNFRPVVNLLGNGNFNLWDLGAIPTVADNSYFAPGWRYLSDATSFPAASRSSSSPQTGSRYFANIAGVKAGNASAGAFAVIKTDDSIPLQGKTVTLSFQAKITGTGTIYATILSWTGAADGATADPIAAWNGASIPTFAAGYTVESAHVALSTSTSWTLLTVTAALATASINNVAVLIYGVGSGGIAFGLGQAQLHIGPVAIDFIHRPVQQERVFVAKNNYEATAGPAVTDDITAGYALGSHWINVTADDAYSCLDCTAGAAVWKKTSP